MRLRSLTEPHWGSPPDSYASVYRSIGVLRPWWASEFLLLILLMRYGVTACADLNTNSVSIAATLWRGQLSIWEFKRKHFTPNLRFFGEGTLNWDSWDCSLASVLDLRNLKAREISSPSAVQTFETQNLAQSTGQAVAVNKWRALPSKRLYSYPNPYGWHSMSEGAWTHVALLLLHIQWLMEMHNGVSLYLNMHAQYTLRSFSYSLLASCCLLCFQVDASDSFHSSYTLRPAN